MPIRDSLAEGWRYWVDKGWSGRDVHTMEAASSIMRAHQIILASVSEALKPVNLTFARFEALAAIDSTPGGSIPLYELSKSLMVHPATVTNSVDRLEKVGYVERRPHPTDRRAVLAVITKEGRKAVLKAEDLVAEAGFGLGPLTNEELATLTQIITRLRAGTGDFQRPA